MEKRKKKLPKHHEEKCMNERYEMTLDELQEFIKTMEEDTTVTVIIEREDADGEDR